MKTVAALLLLQGAPDPPPAWQTALAPRVPNFIERLNSPDEVVRRTLLTHLTYFRPRDSAHYPGYFRHLLKDPWPSLRWEALHRLWEHGIVLSKDELPESFAAPCVGLVRREDAAKLRVLGDANAPLAGWTLHVLGILGDREAAPAARQLLDSTNVFVRFSAAAALVRLGEKADGVAALESLLEARDDPSGFYRYRSAEILVRLGKKERLEVLIDMLERGVRNDYADGPIQILEDLTGAFHPTPAAWRAWWTAQKAQK